MPPICNNCCITSQNINYHPERITNIGSFINNYNLNDTEFPSYSKNWKKFEQSNKTITLNILFVPYNTKEIRQAYTSKYNSKRDNQVILLMITDGEKWHYLCSKKYIEIIKRNNIKSQWRFLLFKLLSLVHNNKKKTYKP